MSSASGAIYINFYINNGTVHIIVTQPPGGEATCYGALVSTKKPEHPHPRYIISVRRNLHNNHTFIASITQAGVWQS